jgi:hypothetical protein
VTIVVEHVGHKANLFGDQRDGFASTISFALKDYRIDYRLELASHKVRLLLSK